MKHNEIRVGKSCPKCRRKIISWNGLGIDPDEYDGQADCVIEFDDHIIEINHQPMFT